MKLQDLLSFFGKKKRKLKTPRPHTIRNNYACENIDLELTIKAYLNGTLPAEECLARFITNMAYHDDFHIPENAEIFPLLEDFLQGATWKEKWTADCGDYNPHRPEPWLRCVHSIYSNILTDIKTAEILLEQWNKELTYEELMKVCHNKTITPEMYADKDGIKTKRDELKAIVDKGEFTPLEALLLIKDNWSLLYPYQSSYEAIEYCVAASENHTEPKYFDSAFRDYGYKMGELYRKAKEK